MNKSIFLVLALASFSLSQSAKATFQFEFFDNVGNLINTGGPGGTTPGSLFDISGVTDVLSNRAPTVTAEADDLFLYVGAEQQFGTATDNALRNARLNSISNNTGGLFTTPTFFVDDFPEFDDSLGGAELDGSSLQNRLHSTALVRVTGTFQVDTPGTYHLGLVTDDRVSIRFNGDTNSDVTSSFIGTSAAVTTIPVSFQQTQNTFELLFLDTLDIGFTAVALSNTADGPAPTAVNPANFRRLTSVPEPGTLPLLGVALLTLAFRENRRKKRKFALSTA